MSVCSVFSDSALGSSLEFSAFEASESLNLLFIQGSTSINEVLADTGYDSHKSYKICEDRNIKTIIPPPRNAKQTYKNKGNPHRNETINYIQEKGKHAWESKNKGLA